MRHVIEHTKKAKLNASYLQEASQVEGDRHQIYQGLFDSLFLHSSGQARVETNQETG